MTTIELFPDDIYNHKTISQGYPPDWINRDAASMTWSFSAAAPPGSSPRLPQPRKDTRSR